MGCTPAKESTAQLNAIVREHEIQYLEEGKLLILGAGDSGKSTFMKQCKIQFNGGFSRNETRGIAQALRQNTLYSMQKLITVSRHRRLDFGRGIVENFATIRPANELTEEIANAIAAVWRDEDFKNFYYTVRSSSNTPSSVPYYFDNVMRYVGDFKPTEEDFLRCKLKTTGIIEMEAVHNNRKYKLVDVGGQRAERRKWIHCFDDVTAVIFLTSTDGYNMTLEEDGHTNRMKESMEILRDLSSNEHLRDKRFILLFNKNDMLKEKIQSDPLSNHFDDISPKATYDQSMKYIQNMYLNEYGGLVDPIVLETCALEKEICETVFSHFERSTGRKVTL